MSRKNSRLDYQFDNYDKRLISIFDVVGSYFVDVLFNHIYNASKIKVANNSSITDEYKKNVQAYIIEIKNNHNSYSSTVRELYKHFMNFTSYKTISYIRFVDNIVEQIMPEEYFDSLNSNEKDEILGSTICDLISALGVYATNAEMLSRIIDHHDTDFKVTIRMMQHEAITLLLSKRDSIFNKFLKNIGQVKETVSIDMLDNLRGVIKRLVKEKTEFLCYIQKLESKLKNKGNDEKYLRLKDKNSRLKDEIEELYEQLATFEEPKDRKKKNKKRSESTKSVQSIIDVPDNLLEEEPEQVEHKPKRNKDNLKAIREKNKKRFEESDDEEEWSGSGTESGSESDQLLTENLIN
jgi:hypothetical protein